MIFKYGWTDIIVWIIKVIWNDNGGDRQLLMWVKIGEINIKTSRASHWLFKRESGLLEIRLADLALLTYVSTND